MKGLRHWVQAAFAALTNGYVPGFLKGTIYRGPLKQFCVPGLNCYACPGALGSCPIGSLQAVLGSRDFSFSFYIIGFLMLVGAALGRFVCGWLCPIGLVQDLLYKIPFFKKRKKLPGDKVLVWLKYVMLVLFVILLPLFAVNAVGQGQPWFCKYVCPGGMLMGGIPLYLLNPAIADAVGWLYLYRFVLLAALLLLSIVVYRPFCRYLCPLGAVYGLFNPVALARYRVDENKCIKCGKCKSVCNLDIDARRTPNHALCIRCGACKRACPTQAIQGANGRRKACPARTRRA